MKTADDCTTRRMLACVGFVVFHILVTSVAACPYGCSMCDGGRLRCPGAGLTSLPSPIPADTYTIDLTQNNIESLDGLPDLQEVQSFRISLNQLRVIRGGGFDKMPSLQSLDLSMNEIIKVYKNGFRGLKDLQSLSLNGNKLQEIGQIFTHTPMISSLRLGNNEITKIEEENFAMNTMLKLLDLSHNRITSIHGNAFKNLDMLRYLILSNNPITTLPDLTFSSTMLSLADISSCELESVPRTMPPSLTDFRLGNNKITSIHVDDFNNITSLTLLTLNDNKISHVDHRSFENLQELKELWLSRNDLVYIPRGLPKGLVKLFMDNNQVVELEPMLFKEDSVLKVFSLEGNNVGKVHSESLKNLQNLEKLNLQANEISSIQAGTFINLPYLQVLTLNENPIKVFELGSFAELNSLTELSLAFIEGHDNILHENFLVHMTNLTNMDLMSSVKLAKAFLEKFGESAEVTLDNLKKLNLQYNELTTLTEGVKNFFPNIKQLLLDGNLLHCDQRLLWLRAWMQATTTVSFHQYEPPICNSPDSVKGRLVSELSPSEFAEILETSDDSVNNQINQNYEQGIENNQIASNNNDAATQESHNDLLQPATQDIVPEPTYNQPQVIAGTRVIIKPPRNPSATEIRPKNGDKDYEKDAANDDKNKPMTKAERKVARQAERMRKKQLKEERRKKRRNKQNKDDEKARTKRKIRNKDGKSCKVDQDGNTKCRRRERCTVEADGNVKCPKRKNKKDNNAGKNVA